MNIYEIADEYEKLDISKFNLEEMTESELENLYALVEKKKEFKRFNKLAYFKPYPFQEQWIEASKHYKQRYLSAGNRLGKTFGACAELAIHLTGLYPEWWNGAVIDEDEPCVFWCIGVSQDAVNNVLMKELLGVSDCRDLTNLGTGAIPKECIDIFSMDKDGARCKKVSIKHVNGKKNTIHFFASTQDEAVLMGSSVKYVLMDEQFKNETEIYAQALTRTATTSGYISVTCTPEQGKTPLWEKFNTDDSGYLYFQKATWDDAPHLTEEDKQRLLAGFPEYQKEMRMNGTPVLGAGAVYPFSDKEIDGVLTIDQIKTNPFAYKLLWGCDFGYSSNIDADPSTLILTAYEMETDRIYIVDEWDSKKDVKANRLSHMPEHMASIIKNSAFPYAPLIVPHDAKKQIDGLGTNTTRLSEFKRYGVNVLPQVFEIPHQLTNGAIEKPKHSRSLHWTIGYVNKLFSEDKLKINLKKLKGLVDELRNYVWKENGEPRDSRNHFLDAMRIAAISIKFKGELASRCMTGGYKGKWDTGNRINKAFAERHF